MKPGSGPRHLVFSPNGKYAYLMSELSGKVTVYSYSDGKLRNSSLLLPITLTHVVVLISMSVLMECLFMPAHV